MSGTAATGDATATRGAPVRYRPRIRGPIVELVVFAAAWLLGVTLSPGWVRLVAAVLLLPSLAFRVLKVVGIARQSWAVEIGPSGVRWSPSGQPLSWSELERVEVHVARGVRRWLPHGFDRVLFVTPVEAAFADRARSAPTSRAVLLARVRVAPEDVVAAVRRFSDVPVHGWPRESAD